VDKASALEDAIQDGGRQVLVMQNLNMRRRSSMLSQLRYASLIDRQAVVFPTWRGPETKAIWRCLRRWSVKTSL
jgi:hypothetical protein